MGALEYHLGQLQDAGLVTVLQEEHKRFFPAEMDRRDKRVLAMLRQRLARHALLVLLDEGETTKTRLTERLDVAPSTLQYHLQHLSEAGLVVAERSGREAVFRIADPEAVVRLLVSYRSSLVDRLVDSFLEGIEAMRSGEARPKT